ncbi:MAG: ribonuclease III, partial [Phycisphaerales bacterium]|nr:ribonuclease III [Phycisphaerales bacterium]
NERLEFLGDAILGAVVCQYLFSKYEEYLEGELTKIKSSVVSRKVCAEVARELNLGQLLRLGKGMTTRAALPPSVVAAVFESIIGAIYLDGGFEAASEFILRHLKSRIHCAAQSDHHSNFKSALQQAAQQLFNKAPQYLVLDEQGPDHSKCFEVCVEIGARRFEPCWGPSKKQAEQLAALQALLELDLAERSEHGEITMRTMDAVSD